jgi:hypothetical protein
VSRYLIGQSVTLDFYTVDVTGNLQNCDATPTVTVDSPTAVVSATTTNPTTGRYTVTFEPTHAGRHVVELDGVLDTNPEYGVQYVTVYDGAAEAAGGPFPHGKQSWESVIR